MRDKYRHYINEVEFDDTQEVENRKLLAISRGPNELCKSLIFPSINAIEKEVIRTQQKMALCVRYHREDLEIVGILQIEYDHAHNLELPD